MAARAGPPHAVAAHPGSAVTCLALPREVPLPLVASGAADGTVRVWNLASLALSAKATRGPGGRPDAGSAVQATAVCVPAAATATGTVIGVTGSAAGAVGASAMAAAKAAAARALGGSRGGSLGGSLGGPGQGGRARAPSPGGAVTAVALEAATVAAGYADGR